MAVRPHLPCHPQTFQRSRQNSRHSHPLFPSPTAAKVASSADPAHPAPSNPRPPTPTPTPLPPRPVCPCEGQWKGPAQRPVLIPLEHWTHHRQCHRGLRPPVLHQSEVLVPHILSCLPPTAAAAPLAKRPRWRSFDRQTFPSAPGSVLARRWQPCGVRCTRYSVRMLACRMGGTKKLRIAT